MITVNHKAHQTVWIKAILLAFAGFYLTACTTAGNAIPQGGPTMAQVYEDAMQQSDGETLEQARTQIKNQNINNVENNLSYFTRTQQNEINNLFPQLPNPQIVMYVYPHFAGQDEAPIPGYSTAFNLYEWEYFGMF